MNFLLYLGLLLLSVALAPKPKRPKAASLADFDVPTADASRSVPVAFGTPDISGPNVVWYGHLRVSSIKERSGFSKVTIGYKYYLGMHFTLSHRVDALEQIVIGDRVAWSGDLASGSDSISQPGLFGGDKKEGGISGSFDLLPGDAAQGQNAYLTARLGADVPASRGVTSLVWKQGYIGTSPYLKNWAFRVRRTQIQPDGTAQWQPALADINGNLNAAHIIREALTQPWGMHHPTGNLDEAAFLAAAQTLQTEGFGLSLQWVVAEPIEDFVDRVLEIVDGVRVVDRLSGKLAIKLIRDDYNPATLTVYDESNVLSLDRFERRAWGETINQVQVVWYDPAARKEQVATVQDLGNIQLQGQVVNERREYQGIRSQALATRVATGILRSLSAPLSKLQITVDRTAWQMTRGDVFRFQWSSQISADAVYRVLDVDLGDLADGRIRIEAVEDVFALPTNAIVGTESQGWTDPSTSPAVLEHYRVLQAVYWDLAQALAPADIAALPAGYEFPLVIGASDVGDLYHFTVNVSPNTANDYSPTVSADNAARATLAAVLDKTTTSFTLTGAINDLAVEVGAQRLIIIDDERMRLDSYDPDTGQVTVGRGVLDSVPAGHAAGAEVWFLAQYGELETFNAYSNNSQHDFKLLTTTSLGELDLATAPRIDVDLTQVMPRPYPAGGLRINGNYYPVDFQTWVVTISWTGRNRLTDTGDLRADNSASSSDEEADIVYTVQVYDQTLTLIESAQVAAPLRSYDFNNIPHQATALTVRVLTTNTASGLSSLQYPEVTVSNNAPAFPSPYGHPAFDQQMYALSYYEIQQLGLADPGVNDYAAALALPPGSLGALDVFTPLAQYVGYKHTGTNGALPYVDLSLEERFSGMLTFCLTASITGGGTFIAPDPGVDGTLIYFKQPAHRVYVTYPALLWLNAEWMEIQSLSVHPQHSNVFVATVKRGVLDTLPQAHADGDRGYILSFPAVDERQAYAPATSIDQYALPYDNLAITTEDQTSGMNLVLATRQLLPYPPGNLQVDGSPYDRQQLGAYGVTTVAWNHRSRLVLDPVSYFDPTDYGPEPATSYTVTLRDITGGASTLINTFTTGTKSQNIDMAAEVSNAEGLYRAEVKATRGGSDSVTVNYDFVIGLARDVVLTHYDNGPPHYVGYRYHAGIFTLQTDNLKTVKEQASNVFDEYASTYVWTSPKEIFHVASTWYGIGAIDTQYSRAYLLVSDTNDTTGAITAQPIDGTIMADKRNGHAWYVNSTFIYTANRIQTVGDHNGPFRAYTSTDFLAWSDLGSESPTMTDFVCVGLFWSPTNTNYVLVGYKDDLEPAGGDNPTLHVYTTTDFITYTANASFDAIKPANGSVESVVFDGTNMVIAAGSFFARSGNEGSTWTDVSAQFSTVAGELAQAGTNLVMLPKNDEQVWYYSSNGGVTWSNPTTAPPAGVQELFHAIQGPSNELVAGYKVGPVWSPIDGVAMHYYKTTDGGVNWSAMNDYV